MKDLRAWAQENGYTETYNQYAADVEALNEQLEQEGIPSNGSTFEARLAGIQSQYPELFGDDPDGEDEDLAIYLDTTNLQAYTDSQTIDLPPRYRERVQAIMDNEELDPEDRERMLRQIEADLEADPEIVEALR